MTGRMKRPQMSGLLALLLLSIFAVCILSVLLTGADAYRRLTERDRTAYDCRTAAQYLATKVRQSDADAREVRVGPFDGAASDGTAPLKGDTLFLTEKIDGESYDTRIYCRDGYLRELFSSAEDPFSAEDGEKVLPADRVEFCWEDGLLTAALTMADGRTERVSLSLRSGEGAAS